MQSTVAEKAWPQVTAVGLNMSPVEAESRKEIGPDYNTSKLAFSESLLPISIALP